MVCDKLTAAQPLRAEAPASGGAVSSWTDEALAVRACADDSRATDELVRRYQEKVYHIAYGMCDGDPEEARDLSQEAFLKAFRSLPGFKGEARFYTWFYRIVVNTCLDARRRRQRWRRLLHFGGRRGEEEPTGGDPAENAACDTCSDPLQSLSDREMRRDLKAALKTLPPKQRLVFQLKIQEEMSLRDIARIMGAAEGTVKSHLFRATRALRVALAAYAER
ncbi:MAG: sigma-70 family RNA polymerase sigma factor [Desulfobacteraceae bacterium]|nr:sigma-70 family RNA polymerase sigma factor [Desulfobacteraceae bacterium]